MTVKKLMEIPDTKFGSWDFNMMSINPKEITRNTITEYPYFIKNFKGNYYYIFWDNYDTWYLVLEDDDVDEVKYYVAGYLKLIKYNKLPNAMQVDGIEIHKKYRGLGLSTFLYRCVKAKKGYSIVSDYIQYDNARKIWVSLAKKDGVKIFDEKTNKKSENIAIKDFNDDSIWGYKHKTKVLVLENRITL